MENIDVKEVMASVLFPNESIKLGFHAERKSILLMLVDFDPPPKDFDRQRYLILPSLTWEENNPDLGLPEPWCCKLSVDSTSRGTWHRALYS